MNYPVWPDSGVSYPRTLLNSGSMRSLPPPPPPTGNGGTHGNSNGNDDGSKCPPKYATPGVVEQRAAAVAAAAAAAAAAASGSSGRLGEECAGARGQGSVSDKYAPLSSFTDDDSLLKVNSGITILEWPELNFLCLFAGGYPFLERRRSRTPLRAIG